MVCLVINGDALPHGEAFVERLRAIPGMTSISFNVNKEKTNVILGRKVVDLYGPGYITDYIGEVRYRISPLSFYQVNPVQTEKLYGTALEYAGLTGGETVWDLYLSLIHIYHGPGVCGAVAVQYNGAAVVHDPDARA